MTDGSLPYRRIVNRTDLLALVGNTGEAVQVLESMVNARMLTASDRITEEQKPEVVYEISAEAVLRHPALQEYLKKHRRLLEDRTLLESRTRKWESLGKPWFSGLAIGREYEDFQRASGSSTAAMLDYLRASRRRRWIILGANAMIFFLLILFISL
jgi:hypothetical protein